MDKTTIKLQVLFEDPFWIGVVERVRGGRISVSKITFGAEPKDYEVYSYLLARFENLRFSPWIENSVQKVKHKNPKRLARDVQKELKNTSISTKSQKALALERESAKIVRKQHSKERKEWMEERKYALRQEKKRQKHKGR